MAITRLCVCALCRQSGLCGLRSGACGPRDDRSCRLFCVPICRNCAFARIGSASSSALHFSCLRLRALHCETAWAWACACIVVSDTTQMKAGSGDGASTVSRFVTCRSRLRFETAIAVCARVNRSRWTSWSCSRRLQMVSLSLSLSVCLCVGLLNVMIHLAHPCTRLVPAQSCSISQENEEKEK